MKILIFLFILSFSNSSFSKSWHKLESSIDSIEINEEQLESKLWEKIKTMSVGYIPKQADFIYQYKIANSDLVVISGFCKTNSFFEKADLTKQEISVMDGGTCYFTAWYSIAIDSFRVDFNGEA